MSGTRMKARIRRISASVDTAISFNSSASADATCSTTSHDLNSSTEMQHGYNPNSKSLDIVPESRIERMRKLLSSPLLRRRNASQHGPNCINSQHTGHHHHQGTGGGGGGSSGSGHCCKTMPPPSSSSSSSPSSSPALGTSISATTTTATTTTSSMKTFGVSLESLSHHQHPHHHQHQHQQQPQYNQEEYARDPEQIVVPHQKAAHVLGQVCPGCLTSAPSNSSSTGSINDATNNTTTTSSGHFSHHVSSSHTDADFFPSSMSSSMGASPSSGNSSSSTTSSTSSTGGLGPGAGSTCLIPFIVTRLCNYIESNGGISHEGLFRISGKATLVEKMKFSFDSTGDAPLEAEGDLASAAALLKQFLRELPQPLIPNGLQFVDVIRSLKNDHDTCVLSVKALVSQLPDENYYTLRYLVRFLYRIAQRNEENRMTSSNLGIVFAPNIFRVCTDSYQGLRDQSAANEVVNLLIAEFADIFNETVGGTESSREDLSSAISCESAECPFGSCSLELPGGSETGGGSHEHNLEQLQHQFHSPQQPRPSSDAMLECDRKRKDYKSKNCHRTIDASSFDGDGCGAERCQSFDGALTGVGSSSMGGVGSAKLVPPIERCNSDGNGGEEMTVGLPGGSGDSSELSSVDGLTTTTTVTQVGVGGGSGGSSGSGGSGRKQLLTSCLSSDAQIIITNSSDSVSTDDNTTTTATGATVRSVCSVGYAVGGGSAQLLTGRCSERLLSSSDDNPDKSSSFTGSDPRMQLYCCDNAAAGSGGPHASGPGASGSASELFCGHLKTGRSGSCGSDCTENIATFTSDDDEDEDSLSKSIASDCSSNPSSSSSSCSSNLSGNEAGSSSSLNDTNGHPQQQQQQHQQQQPQSHPKHGNRAMHSAHLHRPWKSTQSTSSSDGHPQLSCERLTFDNSPMSSPMFDFMQRRADFNDSDRPVQVGIGTVEDIASGGMSCEEAPVSPSAYRGYLNCQLEDDGCTMPPSPPVSADAAGMARKSVMAFSEDSPLRTMPSKLTASAGGNNKAPGHRARNKRFQSIRRKLRQFDVDFETENGYQPTYDHKMASSFARPLMIELSSLLNVRTGSLRTIDYYEVETMETGREEADGAFGGLASLAAASTSADIDGAAFDGGALSSLSANARSNISRKYGCTPEPTSTVPAKPLSTEDIFNTIFGSAKEKSLVKIGEMMDEIQHTLSEKRVIAGRPESLDAMTSEQIFDEKLALQKALLRFEALHGRPDSKAERDIVRPVYDRYRLVKRYAARMISKIGAGGKDATTELQPIIEHQVCSFKSPSHSRSSSFQITESTEEVMTLTATVEGKDSNKTLSYSFVESHTTTTNTTVSVDCPTIVIVSHGNALPDKGSTEENSENKSSIANSSAQTAVIAAAAATETQTAQTTTKNFHEMSYEELLAHLREMRMQKRNVRSVLRTFENDFYKKTGRRVEKEDRCNMSSVYHCYKNTKGKIRLLEALVAKMQREQQQAESLKNG